MPCLCFNPLSRIWQEAYIHGKKPIQMKRDLYIHEKRPIKINPHGKIGQGATWKETNTYEKGPSFCKRYLQIRPTKAILRSRRPSVSWIFAPKTFWRLNQRVGSWDRRSWGRIFMRQKVFLNEVSLRDLCIPSFEGIYRSLLQVEFIREQIDSVRIYGQGPRVHKLIRPINSTYQTDPYISSLFRTHSKIKSK